MDNYEKSLPELHFLGEVILVLIQKVVEKILQNNNNKKTIFVTVGNGKFDPIIKEIDRLKGVGAIKEQIVMQIGHGEYQPKNCKWFAFAPSLEEYYNRASLVISHGGPGIVFEVLRRGKPLIAIPNRDRTDPNHQVEYLTAMAKETSGLIYCAKIDFLEKCIEKSRKHKFAKYVQPECKIPEKIVDFLDGKKFSR
jgi:UDP-N-acetylglucosamine transferase subunit ALG13